MNKIQWRIAIPFMLLILVCMVPSGIWIVNYINEIQINNLNSQLEKEAKLISYAIQPLISDANKIEQINKIIKPIGSELGIRTNIISAEGNVLVDTEQDLAVMDNHANRPEFIDAMKNGIGRSIRFSTTTGQRLLYVAVPVIVQGQAVAVVRVSVPFTEQPQPVEWVSRAIMSATALALLLVIVAAIIIGRSICRPLVQLTQASQRMAEGEFLQEINVSSQNEIGQLMQAFNGMSKKVNDSMNAVLEEKSNIAMVLSSMSDGVIMVDLYYNVLLANEAAGKLFERSADEMIGQSLMQAIFDYEIFQVVQACITSNKEQFALTALSLNKKFLRVIADPINNKKLSGALILFQDLTELHKLQSIRQELIVNISHDLKTPLTAIKAMVETLQDGAIKNNAVAGDFLLRIDNEVEKMLQIVAGLTELTRIEMGEAPLNLKTANINNMIEMVIKRLQPQSERKNISFYCKIPVGLPDIIIDQDRIQQVLLNLISNAIKFAREGGKIIISAEINRDSMIVEVEDNGIGISGDDLPHVFERFYKADKARAGAGTGLGLAIVKHTVQAHGGNVWVTSQEGRGSVFSFSLPIVGTSKP